ncbi:MAG: tetratricopeptide repeat protein, partial [Anaerolineae bacterium]|nr:tetratricopeptide repeat protein [Anaerolineae bacterium]
MAKSTVFRWWVVILLVGCWVAAFPAQAQTDLTCDRTASEHRNLGNTYFNGGDYRSAIADYTCALQKDPNDVTSLTFRGAAYGWLGEYENALVDLNAAVEQNRFDWSVYNWRGIVYEWMGDPDSALTDYTRAIDLGGDSPYIPYYNRGNIYYDRKEYDLALADYNASLAANPEYSLVYNNRGNTYIAQGDYEQAISDYNRAIQYQMDDLSIPYFNLGLAYHEQGDYDQALSNLNTAINYNAAYDRAYLLRGTIYQTLEDDAAYADFATYISLVQTHTITKTEAEIAADNPLTMEEGLVYQVTFTAQFGQIVSASAQVIGNAELDPLMVILDSAGNAVAGDDDSGLNLDAVIRQFSPSVTDTYTLLVGHADGGSSGQFNLTLQIGGEPLPEATIYSLYVGNRASVFTTGGDHLNLRSGP